MSVHKIKNKQHEKQFKSKQKTPGFFDGLNGIKYRINNAIFGVIIWLIIYRSILLPMGPDINLLRDLTFWEWFTFWFSAQAPEFYMWGFIVFLTNLFTGFIVSWIFRIRFKYFSFEKNLNARFKPILESLLNSILIWIGVTSLLFDRYWVPVESVAGFFQMFISANFWEFLMICLGIKLFIFYMSDFISDKFAFGG